MKPFFLSVLIFASTSSIAFAASLPKISESDVVNAQHQWGKALISISEKYNAGELGNAKKLAKDMLDKHYAYKDEPVLFKPTLANGEHSFRLTKEGALSYFIGGNTNYPTDKGFALKGWKSYSFKNAGMKFHGDTAYAMSKVSLTDSNGNSTVVDKTWGFRKKAEGEISIILHHSSLPYSGG